MPRSSTTLRQRADAERVEWRPSQAIEVLLQRATAGKQCHRIAVSRCQIVSVLLEHLAAEPHTRLRYFCSPQRTDTCQSGCAAELAVPLNYRNHHYYTSLFELGLFERIGYDGRAGE